MRKTLFIYFIIASACCFGQKLKAKVGAIEIQLVKHSFKKNADRKITKRITNKSNRPSAKLFFNSKGNILKKIKYGTSHTYSLKVIGEIETFTYSKGQLISSLQYNSSCFCKKEIEPYFKTNYIYDEKGILLEQATYDVSNDSLMYTTTFQEDLPESNANSSRLTEKNNTRKISHLYNKSGQLIEYENLISGTGYKNKFHYAKNGLITKIEYFEIYNFDKKYIMKSFYDIKVKTKLELDLKTSKQINEEIEFEI